MYDLPPDEAFNLVEFATKQVENDKLYQRWLISGAHCHISFGRFCQELEPVKAKSDAEVLDDVYKIIASTNTEVV